MIFPKIGIIGHVCIDHNSVDGHNITKWGSSAMYMSKLLQKSYGYLPTIIAPYGEDFTYASEVDMLTEPTESPTLVYENILINGMRTQKCHNYKDALLPVLGDKIQLRLSQLDICFVAPLTPFFDVDTIRKFLSYLPENCLRVLLPQGYMRDFDAQGNVTKRKFIEQADFMGAFDLIIASDEDLDDALETARAWSTHDREPTYVITQAANGATVFQAGKDIHVPTQPLRQEEIVNPVGCGDMFSATLAIERAAGTPIKEAIATAHQRTRQALTEEPLV